MVADIYQDKFIDADEYHEGNEKISFETIINRQMQKCADILSKEYVGGYMKKTKNEDVYIEDVRLALINSVDTLKRLLMPFFKNKETDTIKNIFNDIENYKKEQGENDVYIKGKGKMKIKDLKFLPINSVYLKQFTEYKANKYRELFEELIKNYFKYKTDIASLSVED